MWCSEGDWSPTATEDRLSQPSVGHIQNVDIVFEGTDVAEYHGSTIAMAYFIQLSAGE